MSPSSSAPFEQAASVSSLPPDDFAHAGPSAAQTASASAPATLMSRAGWMNGF